MLMCRRCCRSSCCASIWWFILTHIFGWTIVDPFPSNESGVFALLPHTSNWDFTLSPLLFVLNASFLVKSSLNFLLWFGFPVHPVKRSKSSQQTKMFVKQIKEHPGWLAMWVSGTRKYTNSISSGFYYIAKEANVPISFVGVDWRTKRLFISKTLDPSNMSKDEVLIKLQKFAKDKDLKNSGYRKENASTLKWKDKKIE